MSMNGLSERKFFLGLNPFASLRQTNASTFAVSGQQVAALGTIKATPTGN